MERKGRIYASRVGSSIAYGSKTRPLQVNVGLKFERAEMQMIRSMCGISMKDKTSEELRRLVKVGFMHNEITLSIKVTNPFTPLLLNNLILINEYNLLPTTSTI